MNKLATILLSAIALSFVGCEEQRSQEILDQRAVQDQQSVYAIAQPIPSFDYSIERDVVIQLYEARNQTVATHTVWRSAMGQVEGDCPSVAYPIPYDTSLTNPLQAYRYRETSGHGGFAVGQAEPNGVFASQNSIATWVRCVVEVDGHAQVAPIYVESLVTAYPYPVTVDYENNRVMRAQAGVPTVTLSEE